MPGVGLHRPATALEAEGPGHYAYGQRAQGAGDVGHHRSAAGARAAALTGGDEHHVGALDDLFDLLTVVLGRLAPDFGIGSRAEAAGEFASDVEFDVGVTHQQRLGVGIDGDELDALESLLDHPVDGVDSASADSYNLDDREVVLRCCHDEGPFRSLTCNFMRHGARAVVSKTLTLKLRFSFMST